MGDFLRALILSTVSGTLIAAMLFILKPFVKEEISRSSQYYGWYLPFLRLLLPFTIGGVYIGSLIPSALNHAAPVSAGVASAAASSAVISSSGKAPLGITSAAHAITSSAAAMGSKLPSEVTQAVHNGGTAISGLNPYILAFWLLGVIVFLGLNIAGYLRYARQIKTTRRLLPDPCALELMEECRRKLNLPHALPLYISACAETPMLCGLFRCSVIIPDRAFTQAQLKHAILHELAHYSRRDNILKWVFGYRGEHPLV
jgi:beta-lactamase regulating signal transducer with metallopeptidase domain